MSRVAPAVRRALVVERVHEVDPHLDTDEIAAAIEVVATTGRALGVLADTLSSGPEALLHGAPPTIGRLITELRRRGSNLPEPRCARCGRNWPELIATDQGALCPRCRARATAAPCASCLVEKPVAARRDDRAPLCARCAPKPKRKCSRCHRVRVIARRAHDGVGELCDSCYKGPIAICGICGQRRPCNFATAERPICIACSPRSHRTCAHCGELRPVTANWAEGPVCEPCYRAALGRRGRCAGCQIERRLCFPPGPEARLCADCSGVTPLPSCRSCFIEDYLYLDGNCVRCALKVRAGDLLGGNDGPLAPVYAAIINASNPYSAHNWLRSAKAATVLGELARGELALSHAALDVHPSPRAANYLRHLLVANGVLPLRDEALARLEIWVADQLRAIVDDEQRHVLSTYAHWRVLRRTRSRSGGPLSARMPTAYARCCLKAAIALLRFLDARGLVLSGLSESILELWLTEGPASTQDVGDFLDWTATQKITGRFTVSRRSNQGGKRLDDDTRWALARRLLHDDGIELCDRVAGCLVLLYGQQLSRIVRIERSQLTVAGGVARLRLGNSSIELAPPLDGLFIALARERHAYSGVGSPASTPWLFPGLDPGRPITSQRIGIRLRRLGIEPASGRRSALGHLAATLPAAVLGPLLNLAPTTAVHWVQSVGADWSTYAAELARTGNREG